jgi:ATPase subunit of ABC transporter with duplicated ATPase domains
MMARLCSKAPVKKGVTRRAKDETVTEEEELVNSLDETDPRVALLVKKVTKLYGDLPAVSDLTFHVDHKRCFGLLGANGAGKTTLINMIIG